MIPHGYAIRSATAADVPQLPQIEREAAARFGCLGAELGFSEDEPAMVNTLETFSDARKRGHLWIAADSDGEPVGFALLLVIDGNAHLEELDVLPAHGRNGIGSELVATVCAWAGEMGFDCVTLSTFRDIPWNGPFYRSCGFSVVDPADYTPGLERIVEIENQLGLNTNLRVIMRRSTVGR